MLLCEIYAVVSVVSEFGEEGNNLSNIENINGKMGTYLFNFLIQTNIKCCLYKR